MKNLNEEICSYLFKHPPALKLYEELEKAGHIYLIGGVLREYRDKKEIQDIRDIDIVIDVKMDEYWEMILKNYRPRRNKFGEYKIICDGLIVDMWRLQETWAYKNNVLTCNQSEYLQRLPDTVFLNLDAIVYDVRKNSWYDEKYKQAMQDKVIDVVLEQNPEVMLNIVRTFVLKKKYNMVLSEKLKDIIKEQKKIHKNFLDDLLNIQFYRYKKEILTKEELSIELERISV